MDEADRGSVQTDKEMSAIQQTQARNLLVALNEALDRIDTGTFGKCLSCGQEISVKRLESCSLGTKLHHLPGNDEGLREGEGGKGRRDG